MTTSVPTPETAAGLPHPRPSAQPQPSRRLRLLCYLSPYAEGAELNPRLVCDPDKLVAAGVAEWVGGPESADDDASGG